MIDLASLFGQIDIYLFDQLLRGRIGPGMTVLDAGCGHGRNVVFFLRQAYQVSAVDPDPDAILAVRSLAERLAPELPLSNFRAETVESNSFPDHAADVVISSAVLHFARDESHFEAMLRGTWRLVKPKGLFFAASLRRSAWKAGSPPWAGDVSPFRTAPNDTSSTNRIFSSSRLDSGALWPIP